MEDDLLRIWQAGRSQTVLFVTHDLEEAIGMADRVLVLTSSPGTILGDYRVDLQRPRNLLDIRTDKRFIELYERIWSDLGREVLKARDQARQVVSGGESGDRR
jgi:NitT/TauT family transport system ATP-binding protein